MRNLLSLYGLGVSLLFLDGLCYRLLLFPLWSAFGFVLLYSLLSGRGPRWRCAVGFRRNCLNCWFSVKLDGVMLPFYVFHILCFLFYIFRSRFFILCARFDTDFYVCRPIPISFSFQFILRGRGAAVDAACRCYGLEMLHSVMAEYHDDVYTL